MIAIYIISFFSFVVTIILIFGNTLFALLPVVKNIDLVKSQVSTLLLKKNLISADTTVFSLSNSTLKQSHFVNSDKVNKLLTTNYGNIFYLTSLYGKRVKKVLFELKVYSFIILILSLACILFQFQNGKLILTPTNETLKYILPSQSFLFFLFSIRLIVELNHLEGHLENISIKDFGQLDTTDWWKRIESIGKIAGGIASLIGLLLWIAKACDT